MIGLLLVGGAGATSIDEVPNPRAVDSWVTDLADVLDPETEALLDDRLDALHTELDVEVAVVTLQEVDGTPKEFATGLFNEWGIGDREANNGLLVLLVLGERRLEMETGYGLEGVLPDGWLGTMQQQSMVPAFEEGDYGRGLVAGLERVDARLRGSPDEAMEGTRGAIDVGQPRPQGAPDVVGPVLMVGAGGAVGALGLGGVLWVRRRQRTCPDCDLYMPMLDEVADDAHLDDEQELEEQLGSVDYQVHVCPQCERVRTFPRVRWFSGYDRCPSCSVRARTSTRVTLRHATQSSGGRVRITEDCRSCGNHRTYTRSTPRLPPPSSSSSSSSSGGSSGGSSFGGGSSGGGGAGSSW